MIHVLRKNLLSKADAIKVTWCTTYFSLLFLTVGLATLHIFEEIERPEHKRVIERHREQETSNNWNKSKNHE